ncbi:hypothetical protein [Spirosoma taeanense]|nr:hypothetical protein [Spirosoma taeanense]
MKLRWFIWQKTVRKPLLRRLQNDKNPIYVSDIGITYSYRS